MNGPTFGRTDRQTDRDERKLVHEMGAMIYAIQHDYSLNETMLIDIIGVKRVKVRNG